EGQPSERYPLTFATQLQPGVAEYVARVPSATVDFAYHAWLGDGRTREEARVKLVPRPVVKDLRAWVLLPSYIGLRPDRTPYEQLQPRGDIVALHQSLGRVLIVTQKPIVKAVLELVGSPRKAPRRLDMVLGPGETLAVRTFDLRPDETAYRVHV